MGAPRECALAEELRRKLNDELVPVLGSAEHFLSKVAEKRTDMPFALAAFRKLLSGALRSHVTPTGTAYARYKWRVVPAPVDAVNAAAVRLTWLRSGGAAARANPTVIADRNTSCAVSLMATMTKEEGEESEDGADAVHHSNTYWVPVDVVLETIGVAVLNKKLVSRHVVMLAHLVPAALAKCPQSRQTAVGARELDGSAPLPRGVCKCSAWFCRRQLCSCA